MTEHQDPFAAHSLAGKVAIVTGAASGIGRETAHLMATRGAAVAVADINGPGAASVAKALVADGYSAIHIAVDIADAEQVAAMVSTTIEAFGRLDILDNNAAEAGHVESGGDIDLVELDLEVWDRILAVNLTGAMLGCRYAIPHMLRFGGGSIINTSSVAGLTGQAVHPAYGTAKGGLITLTKYVATRYGKGGIRCNSIAPGVIQTPALDQNVPANVVEVYARHTLTPRLGSAQDIAEVASFLASDAGSFITGQVVVADGGLLAHVPQYADLMNGGS